MTSASDPHRPAIVVLVAEDDMLIRMMAVDALTDAGFAVIEVAHADDALNILTDQAKKSGRYLPIYICLAR